MPGTPSPITWTPWWTCRAVVSCPGPCPLSRTCLPTPSPGPAPHKHTLPHCAGRQAVLGGENKPAPSARCWEGIQTPDLCSLSRLQAVRPRKAPHSCRAWSQGRGGQETGSNKRRGLCALDSFWGLVQALSVSTGGLVTASH